MIRSEKDEGVALVTVMLVGLIMIVLVATGLTVATSGMRQSASVQQSTSALDAAYAGVEDYVARVNQNPDYVKYGNTASTFSATSALTAPDPWNPAFGVGKTDPTKPMTSWAKVAGSDIGTGAQTARFRYEVDTTQYKTNGVVRIRSTGLAGHRTRTLLASLRVRGFVDFTYFTDYEMLDPDLTGAPKSCVAYAWAGRVDNCGGVKDIFFGPDDQINGDLHSNDVLRICSTKINGKVTTANTKVISHGLYYNDQNCTVNPVNLQRDAVLSMPSTNSTMKQDAGCRYTGPTQVTYTADGYMTVVSPWTRFTSVSGSPSNPARCGTLAGLHSANGARVKQLDHDALYVQNVPSSTSDPNYWTPTPRAASDMPAGLKCVDTSGATPSSALDAPDGIGWELTTGPTAVRYPVVGESPATFYQDSKDKSLWSTTRIAYGCRSGDLYVKGKVATQTTAGSENLVYITGDLAYADRASDLLGLVPQNAAIVWNPMSASGDQPMLGEFNRSIDAAIVSVSHSFFVQNYDRGATRGTLSTFGSVAQKFRGPAGRTGTAATGYTKAYQYDPLLKTVSPPKFLEPSATRFDVTRYSFVPLAYIETGASTGQ